MSNTNHTTQASGGIGFFGTLAIVFIVLKLVGTIEWSWLWVLAPLWVPWAVIVAVILVVWFFALIATAFSKR